MVAAAAFGAAVLGAHAAEARQWWVVSAINARCEPSYSPDAMDQYLRSQGIAASVHAGRDMYGNVDRVVLDTSNGFFSFATSPYACQLMLNWGIEHGSVAANRNDLR
jgi:hypothetical protein